MDEDDRRRIRIALASAELSLHPQTLRKYERAGLVRPGRRGAARHYTDEDLERLALIKHLADVRRINVAGMSLALALRDELLALMAEMEDAQAEDAADMARQRLRALLRAYWLE